MSMRRFALITGLVAGTLAFGGTAAFADTVTLDGTVAPHSTVVSTRTTGANSAAQLPLYGEGTANANTIIQVANIDLTSNNTQGIELTASSDGTLTSANGGSLTYQLLLVDDGATQPADTAFSGSSSVVNVTDDFTNNVAAQDLYIEYDAPAYLDPGAYTDDITVTITNDQL